MLMKWCSKVSPISAISSGKQEPQMKSDWHSQIYVFNDWYTLMRLSSKTSFLFSCTTFKLKSESQVPWLFTVLITRFSSLVQCITSDFLSMNNERVCWFNCFQRTNPIWIWNKKIFLLVFCKTEIWLLVNFGPKVTFKIHSLSCLAGGSFP